MDGSNTFQFFLSVLKIVFALFLFQKEENEGK